MAEVGEGGRVPELERPELFVDEFAPIGKGISRQKYDNKIKEENYQKYLEKTVSSTLTS